MENPTRETSFDRLLPVWPHILFFLTPQLPPPLSGVTRQESWWETDEVLALIVDEGSPGVTPRSAIRAPELALLMRTSIAFNNIAARALYHTVICDNLIGLCASFERPPAHPQIASKTELFRRIRALHLEYNRKGDIPFYPTLMYEREPHTWLWVDAPRHHEAGLWQGITEADRIAHTMCGLNKYYSTHGVVPFPALNTVSIGAIFGSQDPLWEQIIDNLNDREGKGSLRAAIPSARRFTSSLFGRCPLVAYCQRGGIGPLACPSTCDDTTPLPHHLASDALFTRHLGRDVRLTHHPPWPIGSRNRWVIDRDLRQYREFSSREVCAMMYAGLESHGWDAEGCNPSVEIYGSSPWVERVTELEEDAEDGNRYVVNFRVIALEEEEAELVRVRRKRNRHRKAKRRTDPPHLAFWKPSPLAPRCEACGWTFQTAETEEDERRIVKARELGLEGSG